MSYLAHIGVMLCMYVVLSVSLNLLVGYSGLMSVCHAAFFGIGAYTFALATTRSDIGWLPAALMAVGLSAILSLIVSVPTLRLRGDYFVLGTLSFQVIVYTVLYNWTPVTGGFYGLSGIPGPRLFRAGGGVGTGVALLFAVAAAACCVAMLAIVARSPFGRVLRSIREDQLAVESLGKNVTGFRLRAFALAASVAAAAGVVYAAYTGYIDPTSFNLDESVFILSCVVIGGAGTIVGPVIGGILLVLMPEAIRLFPIGEAVVSNIRQVILGVLLVAFMRVRPQGIAGDYRFE